MTYIVQRKDRFYVVAYDGLDPLTGKERRRWHPVGHDRHDAELVAARIDRDNAGAAPRRGGPVHLGEFLTGTWLPHQAPPRPRHDRVPVLVVRRPIHQPGHRRRPAPPAAGRSPRRALRPAGDDRRPSRHGSRPKTVHEVHMIVRSSLDLAVRRQLVDHNVAHATHARRHRPTRTRARVLDGPGTGHVPGRRPIAAPLPRASPDRLHRHAPRRGRRAQVVRPRPGHEAAVDLADAAEPRRQPRRVRRQDPHQPTQHRHRRQHDVGARPVAPEALPRRTPPRRRRLDVPQHVGPVPQPRVGQPALRPGREAHARRCRASASTTCATPTRRC